MRTWIKESAAATWGGILLILSTNTFAAERLNLLDTSYMEKSAAALIARSAPVGGETSGLVGVEWSWGAHPRLNLGLTAQNVVQPRRVVIPETNGRTAKANYGQVGLRAEVPVYINILYNVAVDLEIGGLQIGYRERRDDQAATWRQDYATYLASAVTAYLHLTPETDAGLQVGYQKARGVQLAGFDDAGLSGLGFGLRLRRWL